LLPPAAWLQAAGVTPVTVAATALFGGIAVAIAIAAVRPVLLVTRVGIGVVGTAPASVTWIAWSQLTGVSADGPVVNLTTSDHKLYQLMLDSRAAAFLGRMLKRCIVAGAA
jgi:hypothetical protein